MQAIYEIQIGLFAKVGVPYFSDLQTRIAPLSLSLSVSLSSAAVTYAEVTRGLNFRFASKNNRKRGAARYTSLNIVTVTRSFPRVVPNESATQSCNRKYRKRSVAYGLLMRKKQLGHLF